MQSDTGEATESRHEMMKAGKSLVAGSTSRVSRVDLLRNDRDLESAEDVVEKNVRDRSRRCFGIHLSELCPGNILHQDPRIERHAEQLFARVSRHPVTERRTEIHQRVTDGYHFPVKNGR